MASSYIPFKALWHPVYSLYVVARPWVCSCILLRRLKLITFPQCFTPFGTLAICWQSH